MSEDFRPGDIVECVDARPSGIYFPPISFGGLYTVGSYGKNRNLKIVIWLLEIGYPYAEINTPGGVREYYGHLSTRFRKIHRPRAEFLTELLSAPVKLEDA